MYGRPAIANRTHGFVAVPRDSSMIMFLLLLFSFIICSYIFIELENNKNLINIIFLTVRKRHQKKKSCNWKEYGRCETKKSRKISRNAKKQREMRLDSPMFGLTKFLFFAYVLIASKLERSKNLYAYTRPISPLCFIFDRNNSNNCIKNTLWCWLLMEFRRE